MVLATTLFLSLPAPAFAKDTEKGKKDFTFGPTKEEEDKPTINQYDEKYKKGPRGPKEDEDGVNLLPNFHYGLLFLREDNEARREFTMRIMSLGAITGCLDMTPPKLIVEGTGPIMWIKLEESRIGIDKSSQTCSGENKYAYADLKLDADKLTEDGTKKIVIKSKVVGRFSDIDLDIQDESVTVTAKMPDLTPLGIPFKGASDVFTYWFYPENTVILYAPSANSEESIPNAITQLAHANKLIPLQSLYKDFIKPRHVSNQYYFIDPAGTLLAQLKTQDDRVSIGAIETPEVFFGPEGPYNKPVKKTVFAKRPGETD